MKLTDCFQPWFEMQFDYHQTIRPCCYYRGEVDYFDFNSEKDLNIKELWNDKKFQNYRKIISENKYQESNGCSNCEYLNYFNEPIHEHAFKNFFKNSKPKNDKLNNLRIRNLNQAYNEFLTKKIILESLPSRYYINFGNECNFKCTFCYQNIERDQQYNSIVKFDNLKKQAELLKLASQISIIGGEPLVIKESRKFLDFLIENKDFHDLRLELLTNGSLLHHYTERFLAFDNIKMPISMEAIGEDLEKIRIGAKWKKLEENILNFMKIGKKYKKNWEVSIACNVMKTSLTNNNLYRLVEWACKNEIKIHFGYVNGVTQYDIDNEDVFKNPSLLNKGETRNWKKIYQDSLDLLQSYQRHSAYDNLLSIYNFTKDKFNEPWKSRMLKEKTLNLYRTKVKPHLSDKVINQIKNIRKIFNI